MTKTQLPLRHGRCLRRTACLTTAAVLAAGMAVGCSSSESKTSATGTGTGIDITPVAAIAPSVPDRISIPDINVDAKLDTVGLDANGVMETPPADKPMEASWYRQGPTPGEKGAAAIAGHMDTANMPKAVFYNVKNLKKGQEIKVHREDGTTVVFAVDSVETYKKDAFPTDKVYNKTDRSELRLITCGGELGKDRHWDSNVIAFAHLKGETEE
ncbi:class F sortase [Streptomyces sp. NPDC003952]